MSALLFVSNGHGEEAIAARIASEVNALQPRVAIEHLALVGAFGYPSIMRDVGPRRAMPSGGLIAMGNLRNIARDVRSGLLAHTLAQRRFLRQARGRYAGVVAVGDVFALLMARVVRAPTIFVGTAKSAYVAPYGPLEERVLRGARDVFVRDAATAMRLREHGVQAQAPGNVIVDLYAQDEAPPETAFAPLLGLFPGSREAAYADAEFLCAIVRQLAPDAPHVGALLSVAPNIDSVRLRDALAKGGWRVQTHAGAHVPFALYAGERELVRAWNGPLGPVIACATLVLGQAGTANEAAAAAGVPVVAFEGGGEKNAWYRRRQAGLLDGALCVVPAVLPQASARVRELLADDAARARMGATGRERMGPRGGARAIAHAVAQLCA